MVNIEQLRSNFEFLKAETDELIQETYKLRYDIYCLERGFEKPEDNPGGLESDEYDVRSVHALAQHLQSATPVGSVRLILPNGSKHEDFFPIESHLGKKIDFNLLQHFRVPRQQIAEVSRFGITKQFKRRMHESSTCSGVSDFVAYEDDITTLDRRVFPQIIFGLIAMAFSLSKQQGISHWYAVMEPALDRLLRRFGMNFIKIGPVMEYHGLRQPMFASVHTLLSDISKSRPDLWDFIDGLDGIPDDFQVVPDVDPSSISGTYG